MKKIYEYSSFTIAFVFTASQLVILVALGEIEMSFFNLVSWCIAVISWLVFVTVYWKSQQIKRNAVYINAELVPESVRVIPFFREFIIKVVVAYFDPQTGKTTLYKGSTTGYWRQYQTLKNGEKILVRVVYDAKNPSNYQVLLREALIKIW